MHQHDPLSFLPLALPRAPDLTFPLLLSLPPLPYLFFLSIIPLPHVHRREREKRQGSKKLPLVRRDLSQGAMCKEKHEGEVEQQGLYTIKQKDEGNCRKLRFI